MIERDWKGAERLNGIDTKEGSALRAKRADGCDIDSIAAAEIRCCQRHQFRLVGQRSSDEFRSDFAKTSRVQQYDFHSSPLEGEPWINISRILFQITDNFVIGPPFEPVRNHPQTT